MLTHVTADLARVELQFRAVVNRWAEVQAAETHLKRALHLTEADLIRAETLRDQEDIKIGPDVDRQIEQAHHQLAKAKRLAETGEFITAVEAQTVARQLATSAYMAADEQVREINMLQANLETLTHHIHEKMEQYLTETEKLPAVAQTHSTNRLGRQLFDERSKAEQERTATIGLEDRALAQALRAAVDIYEEVNQLAEWTLRQIIADSTEYNELHHQTLTTISAAQTAIAQAEQIVSELDTTGAGQHALHRARATLPSMEAVQHTTKDALLSMRQQAEESARYATLAKNQARWKRRRLDRARENLQALDQRARKIDIEQAGDNDFLEADSSAIQHL